MGDGLADVDDDFDADGLGVAVGFGEAVGDVGGLELATDLLGDGEADDAGADDAGGAPIAAGGGKFSTLALASAAFMNAAHICAGSVPP